MAKAYKKIKNVKCALPEELYNEFILKIRSEGWSVQEAIHRLIYYYVHDRFEIKRKK